MKDYGGKLQGTRLSKKMKRLMLERRGAKKVQINNVEGRKHEGETSKQGSGKRKDYRGK